MTSVLLLNTPRSKSTYSSPGSVDSAMPRISLDVYGFVLLFLVALVGALYYFFYAISDATLAVAVVTLFWATVIFAIASIVEFYPDPEPRRHRRRRLRDAIAVMDPFLGDADRAGDRNRDGSGDEGGGGAPTSRQERRRQQRARVHLEARQ